MSNVLLRAVLETKEPLDLMETLVIQDSQGRKDRRELLERRVHEEKRETQDIQEDKEPKETEEFPVLMGQQDLQENW